MKIKVLSRKVICSNEHSLHNYFGWPSVSRLQDGRLAMTASGFRLGHICPFGKSIISYSTDEGNTWSLPSIIIDTPLDDRDTGITPFGEKSVIVTSFNNSIKAQRNWSALDHSNITYKNSYLDLLSQKSDAEKFLGSTYRISHDCGVTFGDIMNIPVTCPHGPAELPDGNLLYVGRRFSNNDKFTVGETYLACYKMYPDGSYEYLSEIENLENPSGDSVRISCEPHTIVSEDGKIIVHIRVQEIYPNGDPHERGTFTIYQAESSDGGRSFSKPHQILSDRGGSPAHLISHNGYLISTYGYRCQPFGIRAMFSKDNGLTWDTDNIIIDDGPNHDLGYPSSVVLKDGSILTVYYAHVTGDDPAVIHQVIWKYEE